MEGTTLVKNTCHHCGDDCLTTVFVIDEKQFCCHGRVSVYQILVNNGVLYVAISIKPCPTLWFASAFGLYLEV
jgi:hypothetical protein